MKYIYLVFASCLIILASCNKGVVYEQEVKLSGLWDFDEVLEYKIPVQDTSARYDLVAKVVHDKDFSYQNFYVDISTTFPDGKTLSDDVSFQLATGLGSWQGNCGSNSCKVELLLQPSFRFQQIGDYVIRIRNNSREELNGIASVGLSVITIPDSKE